MTDHTFAVSSEFLGEMAGGTELTVDDYHRLLTAERRRVTLDVLADRTVPIGLEDLAARVAERESDGDAAGSEAVSRVALTLHHSHLPMLDEVGVVDYDPGAHRVESRRLPSTP